jgi:hypothetical protein
MVKMPIKDAKIIPPKTGMPTSRPGQLRRAGGHNQRVEAEDECEISHFPDTPRSPQDPRIRTAFTALSRVSRPGLRSRLRQLLAFPECGLSDRIEILLRRKAKRYRFSGDGVSIARVEIPALQAETLRRLDGAEGVAQRHLDQTLKALNLPSQECARTSHPGLMFATRRHAGQH